MLTDYIRDEEEKAAFGFFEHCSALIGDDALSNLIHMIKHDLHTHEINQVISRRRGPEDRPGIQAFLAAVTTEFGAANFASSQFDAACLFLAAALKAGLPNDPDYVAKVSKIADDLATNGKNSNSLEFYQKKLDAVKDADGNFDPDKLASAIGSGAGTIGWLASVGWTTQTALTMVGADRIGDAAVKGVQLLQQAARLPGIRGRAASFALNTAGKAVTSTNLGKLINLGSKLKLGNPYVLAALTVGGYATEYFLSED
jgi:hypothetical protein